MKRWKFRHLLVSVAVVLSFGSCQSSQAAANAKTVTTLFKADEAFNRHDMDQYLTMYADDFQWDIANAPAKIGRSDFANGIKSIPASDPTVRHLQEKILAMGNMVFFDGCSFIYTNPATKRRYRTFHSDMIVLDKGKAQLMTSYSDSAAEAVALGKLSPPLPYPPPPGTRVWPTTVPKPTQLAPAAAQKDAILRFNSHDLDAIASGLSSDASVLISILFDPQNREAYIAWLGVMFAAFPDLKVETLRNTDFANGWVADEIRITGTNSGPYMGHPATGKQIGLRAAWLGDYGKDGLAKVIKLYYDSVLIWNQLGLPNLNL